VIKEVTHNRLKSARLEAFTVVKIHINFFRVKMEAAWSSKTLLPTTTPHSLTSVNNTHNTCNIHQVLCTEESFPIIQMKGIHMKESHIVAYYSP
jgi:hypothetical protein